MSTQSTLAIRAVAHSAHDGTDRDRAMRAQYGGPQRTPEANLMFAILQDAVWLYCRHKPPRHWKGAKHWLEDRGDWGLCSFNQIWALIYPQIDTEKARLKILADPQGELKRLRSMAGCNVQGHHKRGYRHEPPEAA